MSVPVVVGSAAMMGHSVVGERQMFLARSTIDTADLLTI
jgi:hypothetical protein